jgi:hypothetical protein
LASRQDRGGDDSDADAGADDGGGEQVLVHRPVTGAITQSDKFL